MTAAPAPRGRDAARTVKEAGDLCETGQVLAKPYDHAELERNIRALLAR